MLDNVSQLLHVLLQQLLALFIPKKMAKDWLEVMTHVFKDLDVVALLGCAYDTSGLF